MRVAKQRPFRPVTPQGKIIGVNNKFENKGIDKQQGTTRTLYDSLPIDGRTEYRFFEDCQTRNFPLTNMGNEGNRLGVGSSIVCERYYLQVIEVDADGVVTDIFTLAQNLSAPLQIGELALEVANTQVLKQKTSMSSDPRFNKSANHEEHYNFEFDTQLVLPPLFEFVWKYRVGAHAVQEGFHLRLTIEGVGAIIAPRTTF
jgi:hypothetical protein